MPEEKAKIMDISMNNTAGNLKLDFQITKRDSKIPIGGDHTWTMIEHGKSVIELEYNEVKDCWYVKDLDYNIDKVSVSYKKNFVLRRGNERDFTVTYTANNAERKEGLELARELDKKVIQAWSEHPHLRVINNHENFDTKINRVIQDISNVLEIPQQIVEERKYIVRLTGEIPDAIESDITQTYLTSEPRSEVRLRRRTLNGVSVNVRTTKKTLPNNEQVVTERQIDNNLYESLMRQADPYRQSIHKIRKTFIWRGQFFELDTYLAPTSNLQILETKGIVDHEDVNFPPFIEVVEDITGKTEYYNYNLALRK